MELILPETCVVVMGNPVDGFDVIGPFKSRDEAGQYLNQERHEENMWVVDLLAPNIL